MSGDQNDCNPYSLGRKDFIKKLGVNFENIRDIKQGNISSREFGNMGRREFLKLTGLGVSATALSTIVPGFLSGASAQDSSNSINVRDYGAVGDGSTDDTDAINRAIQEASSGDTVLIPSGRYMVYADNRAAIDFTGIADNVTITGEGEDTTLKMMDTPDDMNQWVIGGEADKESMTGLVVKQMVLDGNRQENGDKSTAGVNLYPDGSGHDIRFEDIILENCAGTGFSVSGASKLTLRRITSRNNGQHGFDFSGTGANPDVDAKSLKSVNNDGTGIDFHNGNHVVEDVYCDNNRSGTKMGATGGAADSVTLRNANLRNARENSGFRETMPDGTNTEVTLNNVQVINPAGEGFRFSNSANYDVGEILVQSSGGANNVYITDNATVNADTIRSQNAQNGPGIYYGSSNNSTIQNYYHYQNSEEPVSGDTSKLSIGNTSNQESQFLDVPEAEDVGAYSGSNSGDTGETGKGTVGGKTGNSGQDRQTGQNGHTGGDRDSSSAQQLPEHAIEITSENDGQERSYLFYTNGQVTKQDEHAGPSPKDRVFTSKVVGVSAGGHDGYTVRGHITEFYAEEGIKITYNGREMTPSEFKQTEVCNMSEDTTKTGNSDNSRSSDLDGDSGIVAGAALPRATESSFESELRAVVGAKEGRNWQEFVQDAESRTVHDVTDYGAQMDGQTNDRDSLISALDAAASESPSGIVYIPEGELRYGDEGIKMRKEHSGVSIVGEGQKTVLIPDTVNDGSAGSGYRAMGIWFSNEPSSGRYQDITIANFRMDGSGTESDLIGGRHPEEEHAGTGNTIQNMWLENPRGAAIQQSPAGTHMSDITVEGTGKHGLAIRNGSSSDPTEEKIKSIDPDTKVVERVHVKNSSAPGSGRYAMDISSGANIVVDKFLVENNNNLGMKVPKTRNVRIYNGLFKNNSGTDFQTLSSRWKFKNAYMNNVKVDATGKEVNKVVDFSQGDWTVGLLVVEGGQVNNQIRIADEIGELGFEAHHLISKNSGGDGIYIDDSDATIDIKRVEASGSADCDLNIKDVEVNVEDPAIGRTCGQFNQRPVNISEMPSLEQDQ